MRTLISGGVGAFWLPILLMLASIHFFGNQPNKTILSIAGGGLLLILATGSLLAALIAGLGFGLVAGALNAGVVTIGRINSFIATLARRTSSLRTEATSS